MVTVPPEYENEVRELNEQIRVFHHPALPEISPRHAKVHTRLGIIYFEIGEMKEAEYNLKRSIQMVPGGTEAHLYLGRVYSQTRRHRKAIEEFNLVLQINPTMVEAHKELGDLYQAVGMVREAEAEFRLYENVQSAPSP